MNEADKKRLEEMQAEARTVPLSEKERWLIGQLEAEATEVERQLAPLWPPRRRRKRNELLPEGKGRMAD